MKEPLALKIHGIKCDHCTYKDMNVQPEDYEAWLNRPCPECGENLLTQKDYDMVLHLQEKTAQMNAGFNKLPKFLQKLLVGKQNKTQHIPIDADGSGKIHVDTTKIYQTTDEQ